MPDAWDTGEMEAAPSYTGEYVCPVAEVRGLSEMCEGKKGTRGVCPRLPCVRRSQTATECPRWCEYVCGALFGSREQRVDNGKKRSDEIRMSWLLCKRSGGCLGMGGNGYRMPGTRGKGRAQLYRGRGSQRGPLSRGPGQSRLCCLRWMPGGDVPVSGVVVLAVVLRLVVVGVAGVRVSQLRGGGSRGQARPAGVARGGRGTTPLPPVVVLLGAAGVWGRSARCPVPRLRLMMGLALSRT